MDEIAQILGTYNKELISVDFWKTYSLTPIGIKYLSQCSLLEEIDIGWWLVFSYSPLSIKQFLLEDKER